MKNFSLNNCTACGACINACPVNAISWKLEKYQVEMPSVDTSLCISCKKCIKVCPQSSALEGKYPSECYAAWMKNPADLEKSASGGAARAFSRTILEQSGVVFGCVFQNGKIKHVAVRSLSDLDSLSGSKYVWSDTERTFSETKAALEENIPVLYIGTPCQIDGLKHYLGKAYDNLFLVDLICHGVPPASYINDYVETTFEGKAKEVSFRNRNGAILSGVLESGERFIQKKEGSYEDPYMQAYISGLIYRENCHTCRYANPERVSDITIGDFWGIKPDRLPKEAPELKSVIYINTDNGKKLLERSAAQLHLIPYLVIEGVFGKDNVKRPQYRPTDKDYFFEQLDKYGFSKALKNVEKQRIKQSRRIVPLINKIRSKIELSITALLCKVYHLLTNSPDDPKKKLIQITTINEDFLLGNYGTLFQHYALRKFLKDNGYEVCRNMWEKNQIYTENESYLWWRNQLFYPSRLFYFSLIVLNLLKICPYKGSKYFIRKISYFKPFYFRRFYTKYIGKWREKKHRTPDIYLIGGDQIFFCDTFDAQYYRMVGNIQNGVKISYAASANWNIAEKSDIWKQNTKEMIGGYKAISVREKKGVMILQNILQEKSIARVIDPVLLLDKRDYLSILSAKRIFSKPTLFCYLLHCDAVSLNLDALKEVSKLLNVELKISGIQGTESYLTDKEGLCLSPQSFLRAFRDADYVITNSFHGTVFAALFQKQWVTLNPDNAVLKSSNIRQSEFLGEIGASSQFVRCSVPEIIAGLQSKVNWDSIDSYIKDFKNYSISWLLNALQK